MKKIILPVVIPVFLALTFRAGAATPVGTGPVQFNFTASEQALNYALISAKTNHTSKATNNIAVYKSSTTSFAINDDYLINLLANSFNTNFPAGSKLLITGWGNYTFTVIDKTGTNLIFDVGSVLPITASQRFNVGTETSITNLAGGGLNYSSMDAETFTEYTILAYNDIPRTTGDGMHSDFQFSGQLIEKWSNNFAERVTAEAVVLQGAGGGTIRNDTIILKGTMTAALSSILIL